MRVLVVTTWFPSDERPGEAPFNLEHVRAISLKHDVRVIHVRLGGAGEATTETYAGIRVRRIPLRPGRPVGMLRAVAEIRRAARSADILHTMVFSSVLVASVAHAFSRTPWVHTEHWSGVANPTSVSGIWPRIAWVRNLLRLPQRITGVSTALAATLDRFARPGAVEVVPCVVENRSPVTPVTFGDRIDLVAVGGIVGGKRPLLAVRTLHWLVHDGRDATLTWVGAGPLADEMQRLARDLGVSDRLTLTGSVRPERVFEKLVAAHLFFLPTVGETFLVSAAEALSCGRAVVLPSSGGYRDYVTEANAELVEQDTPDAFGSAIVRAFERFAQVDPHELAKPVRAAFSLDAVCSRFDDIYRAVARP